MSGARRAIYVLAGVFAALAAGGFFAREAIVESLQSERTRLLIERELSTALGLDVQLGNDFKFELFPEPRFSMTQLVVAHGPGHRSQNMMEVGRIELELDIFDLLFGTLEIDELEVVDAEIRVEGGGTPDLPGDLSQLADESVDAALALRLRSLSLEEAHIHYRPEGSNKVWSIVIDELHLEAEAFEKPVDLYARGSVEGSGFEVAGTVGPVSQFFKPTRPYPVSITGNLFEAQVTAVGEIETPMQLAGVDLRVRATLNDLGELPSRLGDQLPPLGPLHFSGHLSETDEKLGIRDLQLGSHWEEPVGLDVAGSITDLEAFAGVDLSLDVELSDFKLLDPFVDVPFPSVSPVRIRAQISDADGSLGIEGEVIGGTPEGPVWFHATGGHSDLSRVKELDLDIRAEVEDLHILGELLGTEVVLPAIGPVTFHGQLRDHEGLVALDDISLEIGSPEKIWASGRGSVGDLQNLLGVSFDAQFLIADLRYVGEITGGSPPDVGPIGGEIRFADEDGTLGIEHFSATGGVDGVFEIEVSGAFDDVFEWDEISIDARLEGRDLDVIGEIFGQELPPIGPVEFQGRVTGANEALVSKGWVLLGQSRFDGYWRGSLVEGDEPRLEAVIYSRHVRLRDIGIEPHAEPITAEDVTAQAERWWTGQERLPFDILEEGELLLDLDVERVTGRSGFDIRGVRANIALDEDRLHISDAAATFEGGTIRAELQVDVTRGTPGLSARVDVRGVDLETLNAQLVEDTESAGTLDMSFDLESKGDTMDELRANLSGEFGARIRQWSLVSQYARRVVKNLARTLLEGSDAEVRNLACMVSRLEIDHGHATVRTLVLEDDDVTVWGAGSIDLAQQTVSIVLEPEVHDPGLLSMAADVKVYGSLIDPEFKASSLSLAASAGKGLLSTALKPGAKLLGLFRGPKPRRENPCDAKLPPSGLD